MQRFYHSWSRSRPWFSIRSILRKRCITKPGNTSDVWKLKIIKWNHDKNNAQQFRWKRLWTNWRKIQIQKPSWERNVVKYSINFQYIA